MTQTASLFAADTLDPSKVHTVDVNGISTRYYEDGEGEPLVLFHGGHFGFLDSLDSWSLNFPGLAKHFHVYAMDKLGQGHTDNPPTDADYTFDFLVDHAAAWLNKLGISQAHIVGHSRGGLLVACLAFQLPGLAKSVIIVDSSTLAPVHPLSPGGVFYERIEARIPPGPPTIETARMEPDENSFSTAHVTDDYLARNMAFALLPKTQHAQARMKEISKTIWMPSVDRRHDDALRLIDERGMPAPTLVIWGHNDPSVLLVRGLGLWDRIAASTPESEFHVLNQAGHYGFREHPHQFNRLLRAFCLE
jgi:pimeloyl-ACP methyl ester carboxylesterase